MSLLDILVLILLVTSTVAGFVAGFARVGIGFLASIFGLLFGFWFFGYPAALFHTFIHSTTISNLLGFLVVFFMFVLLGALVGKLLAKLFRWTGLSWLDRLLGGAFGFARGAFISVIFITALMAFTPNPLPSWMVQSKTLPYAIDASNMLSSLAPASIKDAFRESMRGIRKAWDEEVRRAEEKLRQNKKKRESEPDAGEAEKKAPTQNPAGKKKEKSRVGQSVDF